MTLTHVRLDPTKLGSGAEALEQNLHRLIVGQEEAIQAIVNAYQMHLTGLNAPGRPIANLLFLGPTGSGKTRIVEAMAESLVGSPQAVVKIDCAEYRHDHEIAKLIGSPPGYLGHRETRPLLSQDALDHYLNSLVKISFVLFDEIEKAGEALWNLLLGILDKATLTLGDNRRVDFSRTMIFMTSNLGAAEISAMLSPKVGFAAKSPTPETDGQLARKIGRSAQEAAKRKFTPEFINRLDKIVTFKPLGRNELREILDIELRMVQQQIFQGGSERSFVFVTSDPTKEMLLREGTDTKYGARHLKRAIQRLLVQPLSNLIATGQVRAGDCVRVDFDESLGRLIFVRELEGVASFTMNELAGIAVLPEPVRISISAPLEPPRIWTSSLFR